MAELIGAIAAPKQKAGYGSVKGGVIGHRQNTANGKVKFLTGNGCWKHGDCFTCPFRECKPGKIYKKQEVSDDEQISSVI